MVSEEEHDQPESSTTREILDDLKDWSGRVFQKVREEAVTLTAQGKLKIDLATLKSRRGAEYRELGMQVFHLIEQGSYDIPEVAESLKRLKELAVQIEAAEQQFEQTDRSGEKETDEPDADSGEEEAGV